MSADKSSSRYHEYIEKCEKLFSDYETIIENVRAQYPEWRGRDHPASGEIHELEVERNQKFKALQKEYPDVFQTKYK